MHGNQLAASTVAEYLRKLARLGPRTLCTLLGKVLATQVTAGSNIPIHATDRIEVVVIDPRKQHSPKAVRD